jgi:hypothetical protein
VEDDIGADDLSIAHEYGKKKVEFGSLETFPKEKVRGTVGKAEFFKLVSGVLGKQYPAPSINEDNEDNEEEQEMIKTNERMMLIIDAFVSVFNVFPNASYLNLNQRVLALVKTLDLILNVIHSLTNFII